MTTLTLTEQLRRPRWQDFDDQQDFVAALREWKAVRRAAWEPLLAVIQAAEKDTRCLCGWSQPGRHFPDCIHDRTPALQSAIEALGRAAKQA